MLFFLHGFLKNGGYTVFCDTPCSLAAERDGNERKRESVAAAA